MRWGVAVLVLALGAGADELQRAQELAWARHFTEAEAVYRQILAAQPHSAGARLGLARVVLWQGRYAEALALFRGLDGIEAMEGRATAQYWSGDLRAAARGFRQVLELDPRRSLARQSLGEIESTAVPAQRVNVSGSHDDQPLDAVRSELSATFFSDVQTRWSATLGHYSMDAQRNARGDYAVLGNETAVRVWTLGAAAGLFTFPDGVRRATGNASVRRRSLTLRMDRQPELASAPSVAAHVSSTATTLRWDANHSWLASAELTHRRYSDHNQGRAASAYLLIPLRRHGWTLWSGGSAAVRDTDESRFTAAGRYDPYWTPEDLREVRVVVALERALTTGRLKVHADAGRARDTGRASGVPFDRSSAPWRAGLAADFALRRGLRLETAVERSSTIDYRVTSWHVSLVRRR